MLRSKKINKNTIGSMGICCIALFSLANIQCHQSSASKHTGDFKAEYMHALKDPPRKVDTSLKAKPACCKGAPSRAKALAAAKK